MTPTFLKRFGVLVATALLAATGCSSSDKTTTTAGVPGTFVGTVTGSTGSAIAGVTVTPQPANGPAVVTDSTGKYSLPVSAGTYTLSFSGDNLQNATSASTAVGVGQTVTVDQVMQASPLTVTVNLPAALKNGGPSGFNTTVTGINASVKMNGSDVSADGVTWKITGGDGVSAPPSADTAPITGTGASTSFAIPDLETVRQGANAWLNARYATTGDAAFEYIQAPERVQRVKEASDGAVMKVWDTLLSFGPQQVSAMSYKIVARVTSGNLTSTGSATISPVTINSGHNEQPLGMMIVANAPKATSYSWTLQVLTDKTTNPVVDASWAAATDGVTFQGATTKNPTAVITKAGVYRVFNGTDTPFVFRISTYHGAGPTAADAGTDGINCTSTCHVDKTSTGGEDYSLNAKFAEWGNSAHGNTNWLDPSKPAMGLFQGGLDGYVEPGSYSARCIGCHTVGYSLVPSTLSTGGTPSGSRNFADVAANPQNAAEVWTFPPAKKNDDGTYAAAPWGYFDAMPAELKHRAGIQCESCHGPLEPTGHGEAESLFALFGLPLSPTAGMDAGVCLQCHDSLPHHDKGPLWAASGHARMEFVAEATIEGRGTGVENCARCHAGEGFVVYVDQLKAGNGGLLARPSSVTPLDGTTPTCVPDTTNYASNADPNCACASSADYQAAGLPDLAKVTPQNCYNDKPFYDYFKSLQLTDGGAHSQTCQTCHDPHSTELRMDGDTYVNAALFRIPNAGAGALCITCHNSRSGEVREGTAFAFKSTSLGRLGPHVATQGDMFAGRNAFFMDNLTASESAATLPYESAHAFLSDTCVNCHVTYVPADLKAQFNPAGTNHTFRASLQVCSDCHAEDIGERIQESISDKMATLQGQLTSIISEKMMRTAGFVTAAQARKDPKDTSITLPDPTDRTVLPANVRTIQVRMDASAVVVTLTDGSSFYVAFDKIYVGGTTTSILPVADTTNVQPFLKADFNLLFVNNDGAKGIHNPSFAAAILDNAGKALVGPPAVVLP